ncbi:MAG TPA: META domain-containing protein [Solirubrobacterales bacterium]|nr:META domain-containing protein [Solirubrobacterales bacterium]
MIRSARFLAFLVLLSLPLGLNACGSESGQSESSRQEQMTGDLAPATLKDLNGEFISVSIEGMELPENSRVRMNFEGRRIGMQIACNSIGGDFQLDNGRIKVRKLGTTLRACRGEAGEADEWIEAFMTAGPEAGMDGDRLVLTGPDATLILQREDQTRPSLIGNEWTLNSIVSGQAASSLPTGVKPPTITFTGESAALFTGCKRGLVRVRISDGGFIHFGEFKAGGRRCGPAANQIESQVLGVLRGKVSWGWQQWKLALSRHGESLVFTTD